MLRFVNLQLDHLGAFLDLIFHVLNRLPTCNHFFFQFADFLSQVPNQFILIFKAWLKLNVLSLYIFQLLILSIVSKLLSLRQFCYHFFIMFYCSLQLFDGILKCPNLRPQFVRNSFHLIFVLFRLVQLLLQLLKLLLFSLVIAIE